jgi:hypothetical protein
MYCCRMLGCTVKDGRPCIVMKWFGRSHLQVPPGKHSCNPEVPLALLSSLQTGSRQLQKLTGRLLTGYWHSLTVATPVAASRRSGTVAFCGVRATAACMHARLLS